MIYNLNREANFLLFYQAAIAIVSVFTFFTNLDLYLYSSGSISYPPLFLIIALSLFSTPILLKNEKWIASSLIGWIIIYLLVSSLTFLFIVNNDVNYYTAIQEFRNRILSVFFLLLMLLIFSRSYLVQLWARRTILISVFIAVINNIYDFLHPLIFSSLNVGRPAGFYINPNQAASALVLGMIFSIGVLRPKYRVPFVFIVGIGVLLTLSRGAIIGWIIVAFLLVKTKVISLKSLLKTMAALALIALCIGFYKGNLLDGLGSINGFFNYALSSRFRWLHDPGMTNSSDSLRLRVLELAWELFREHPLLGNGLGSTLDWSESVSTHNMYLYLMADHGILGAFIFPLLVFAVTQQAQGEAKSIGILFAAFILVWGLFSHNILSELYILTTFSLMGAMTLTSRQEQSSIHPINQQEI